MHLRSGAMLHLTSAPRLAVLLFDHLFAPILITLLAFLLLSFLLTVQISHDVVRPVIRVSLVVPRRQSICPRLLPLIQHVGARGQRVCDRIRALGTRRRQRSYVHHRFATGMARRLGAPLASVSNFTRLVQSKLIGTRSMPHFTKDVCSRDRHLCALMRSVVGLSHVSDHISVPRGTPIGLLRIYRVITSRLRPTTQHGRMALRMRNRTLAIFNTRSVLCRVMCGLYSGTVGCGQPNNLIAINIGGINTVSILAIRSANVNVPPRRRDHVFRQFCQISGDRSGRVNNAKLKLSVMGRDTAFRVTRVRIRDALKRNAAVAIGFPTAAMRDIWSLQEVRS